MSGVAKRYARAALSAAHDRGGSKAVDQMVLGARAFEKALESSSALREVVKNPLLLPERHATLKAVLEKLGAGTDTERLVQVLVDSDRLDVLPEVANEMEAIADEQAGRLRAVVTSATALTDGQLQKLTRALEKRMGKSVVVVVEIDANLIGGLVCRVGGVTLDTSVRTQLQLLRERLLS